MTSSYSYTRRHRSGRDAREGLLLRFVLVALFSFFGILNLIQVNAASTRGFTMSELEQKIEALKEEQRRLDVAIAEHGSLARLQERVKELGFVPVEEIEYIVGAGNTVAWR